MGLNEDVEALEVHHLAQLCDRKGRLRKSVVVGYGRLRSLTVGRRDRKGYLQAFLVIVSGSGFPV